MDKSELAFLALCIPSRIAIALAARQYPKEIVPMAIAFAIGSVYFYMSGTRQTGLETMGRPIWWNDMRPLHALLWTAFVVAALQGKQWAWKFLALDVTLGLASFFFLKPRN